MRDSRVVAKWLLERLRIDAGLAGDLLEERENGRSAIWYWRQVLTAVAVNIWLDVRAHKVVMLGAVLTGIAAETALLGLYASMSSRPAAGTIGLLAVSVTQIATGWLIARTSRTYPIPSLLASLTFGLAWWVYGKFSLINLTWWAYRNLSYQLSTLVIAAVSLFIGVWLSRSLRLAAGERAEN